MIQISNGSLSELLKAATTGPFMQAEIYSLTGLGNVRVTCNWAYSALNIDPSNGAEFLWQFSKVDDNNISLSPVSSCIDKTIYASVRDDNGYYLKVQAPFSADWITEVRRDEIIALKMHDLNVAELKGFNGAFFFLDNGMSSYQNHSGYCIRSIGRTFDQNMQWYLKIKRSLQDGIDFSGSDHSLSAVKNQLDNSGIQLDAATLNTLVAQLNAH